jgi:hypothetical protein
MDLIAGRHYAQAFQAKDSRAGLSWATAAVQLPETNLPGLSEKSTDAMGAPTRTQPGGFIVGSQDFFRCRSINRDDHRPDLPARAKFLGSQKVQLSSAFVYNFWRRNTLPKYRESR